MGKMDKTNATCLYENLTPYRRDEYWVFWTLIALCAYVLADFNIKFYEVEKFYWTQAIFAFGTGALPITYIKFIKKFRHSMTSISAIFWPDQEDFTAWLNSRTIEIGTFKTWQAKAVTSFIFFPGLATVLYLGLPFRNMAANIFALLWFAYGLIICGHGLYICMSLLGILNELKRRKFELPFSKWKFQR
jgi:hypothetical protein